MLTKKSLESKMKRVKYIDMHCHILPGVDDGAQNLKETEQMLKIAYQEGIRAIVATPHHHDRRGKATIPQLNCQLQKVKELIRELDINMKIYPGMEVFFVREILEELNQGTIAMIGKSRYILIEFSPEDTFSYIQRAVQEVQMKGCRVIIAHAERYMCLVKKPERIRSLVEMGAYIQVNASSIIGGFAVRRLVKTIMKERLVHFVGTDAHDPKYRSPAMKKAATYVEKKHGHEYMEQIFWKNGIAVLRNEKI